MSSYGYIENNRIIAPVAMRSRYKGVGAWHLLTDEQRAAYGWYPCVVIGEGYDAALQVRSELPECVFDPKTKTITVTYKSVDKPIEAVKVEQKQRITESRYQEEVSGKTIDGVFYDTDRTTQVMLGNAFSLVQFDPEIAEVDWKSSDGSWTKVSKTQLLEMGKIVGRHVQDCFSKECRLHKLIDACETKEEVIRVVWEE